ncbi:hypothetical protein HDU76_011555, partial [Blyttiomyces sp. JEL0837]
MFNPILSRIVFKKPRSNETSRDSFDRWWETTSVRDAVIRHLSKGRCKGVAGGGSGASGGGSS